MDGNRMNGGGGMEFNFSMGGPMKGQAVTAAEAEAFLLAQLDTGQKPQDDVLWELANLYNRTGRRDDARRCIERVLALNDGPQARPACLLALGQTMEGDGDFPAAIGYYTQALPYEQADARTRYLVRNNLGYSYAMLGRYSEAVEPLREARSIDPSRPNAHKNLGIALAGLGLHREAAECWIEATQVDAHDCRSLRHLDDLLAERPELAQLYPDLPKQIEACRAMVEVVRAAQPDYEAQWKKMRRIQRDKN